MADEKPKDAQPFILAAALAAVTEQQLRQMLASPLYNLTRRRPPEPITGLRREWTYASDAECREAAGLGPLPQAKPPEPELTGLRPKRKIVLD